MKTLQWLSTCTIVGIGDIPINAVRFDCYVFENTELRLHPICDRETDKPPKLVGKYSLTGYDLLVSLYNLFEEINYSKNKKSRTSLIAAWCETHIHPYNINTLFEDIESFEEYEKWCNYTPSDNPTKMELLLHRGNSHTNVTVTDWHDSLDRWFELDGTFIIDDFMRDLEYLYYAIKIYHAIKAIEEDGDTSIARSIAKEGRWTDGREDISNELLAGKPLKAKCYHNLAQLCEILNMRLQYNEMEKKFVFVPEIKSVFDIAWYSLICTISSNALGTTNSKINNRVIRCPNCGTLFVASSNRQIYCDSYECQAYRNCKKQKSFQEKKKKSSKPE